MPTATEDFNPLSPDAAFSLLGNPTRISILQVLGEADEPLSFSALRDRVGTRDSGQFNYHLDKLTGHYLLKREDGYELREAGKRIIEAVLSGAITDDPVLETTTIDFGCRLCGSDIELAYFQERVRLYCTNCPGLYPDPGIDEVGSQPDTGYVGSQPLPPAGIKGRSPEKVLKAAITHGHLEFISAANGLCPRCSGIVEHSVQFCENHNREEGSCQECGNRHAVHIIGRCTNCVYRVGGILLNHLIGSVELRQFVAEQGLDPIVDGEQWGWDFDEEVLSVDPFRARYTIPVGEASITLTVDEDLSVIDTAESTTLSSESVANGKG